MFKPTIVKLVIALVLGGGFFFVARNAHFDPFPCKRASYSYQLKRLEPVTDGTCSMWQVRRSGGPGEDYAEFKPEAYALGVVLFGLLPYLAGCLIGHAFRRRRKT